MSESKLHCIDNKEQHEGTTSSVLCRGACSNEAGLAEAVAGFSLKTCAVEARNLGGWRDPHAYNPCMFHALTASLGAALAERITLLLNHVLASESVATERLRPHRGRNIRLQLDAWPALLPALPALAFRITPAGLLEWCGAEPPATPDLTLRLDASNPALQLAQWASGERPAVAVQGDAQFAADLSWLMDNLRWDVQDDLARLVGQAPAHEIARLGRALAGGLREAVRVLSSLASRAATGAPGPR